MLIYLDSSALVKLVRPEPGSAALKEWLAARSEPVLISSALADVEVTRAVRRSAPELVDRVPALIDALQLVEVRPSVRALAGSYHSPVLRAADAVHLASAELIQREAQLRLESFVCYDRLLLAAATERDLPVASPV